MTRPKDLFEAASYDLNKFRERRIAERRSTPRNTADRRVNGQGDGQDRSAQHSEKTVNPNTKP